MDFSRALGNAPKCRVDADGMRLVGDQEIGGKSDAVEQRDENAT